MNFPRLIAVLLLAGAAAASDAAERRYSIGLHDFAVPYNLDIYQCPDDPLAILPWDDDLLIRLSFSATR